MTSWKSRLMKLLVNDIWHSWVGTSPTTLHTYSDTIFILYSKQVVQCAFTFTSKAYAVNMYWTREYMQVCIGPTPMQLPTTLSIDHFVGRVSLPGKWWPKIRPIRPIIYWDWLCSALLLWHSTSGNQVYTCHWTKPLG